MDLSPTSFAAAKAVLAAFGRKRGVLITLLHVVDHDGATTATSVKRMPGTILQQRVNDAERTLARFLEDLGLPESMGIDVQIGDPVTVICDVAHDEYYDLLVVPAHGKAGRGGPLFGHTAGRLVPQATTPVLILRPEKTAKGESLPEQVKLSLDHLVVGID